MAGNALCVVENLFTACKITSASDFPEQRLQLSSNPFFDQFTRWPRNISLFRRMHLVVFSQHVRHCNDLFRSHCKLHFFMSVRHEVCETGAVIESNAGLLKPLIHLSGMFCRIRLIPPRQIGSAKFRCPSCFDVTQTDRVHDLLFLSRCGLQQCNGFLHRIGSVESNQDLAEFAIYGLACGRIKRRNIVDDLLCDVAGGNPMPRD